MSDGAVCKELLKIGGPVASGPLAGGDKTAPPANRSLTRAALFAACLSIGIER